MPEVFQRTFANGLTLLAEKIPNVRSASFQMFLPAGAAYDPQGRFGLATIVCDLMTRGAGKYSSRELSDALDGLGLDHGESPGTIHVALSGATLARNLLPALSIYADILQRPHLPEAELEAAKSLSIQDIESMEDDPQRQVSVELRQRYYPDPLGRDAKGTLEGVEAITIDDVRKYHAQHFHPDKMIMAVAGDIDWPALSGEVERLFGPWAGQPRQPLAPQPVSPRPGHLSKELEQTQIAFACPGIPATHPDIYKLRGLLGVLSLDMSSRLFSNVREKHGLCYSVFASYESYQDRATVFGYAGARPELAQETLERTIFEFNNLINGIEEDEVDRVKIGLKSSLIMRQESSSARSSALASDWYLLGRVRPLSEIQANLEKLTAKDLVRFAETNPFGPFTLVTLGPNELTLPG